MKSESEIKARLMALYNPMLYFFMDNKELEAIKTTLKWVLDGED